MDRVHIVIADILKVPYDSISDESTAENMENWDSLSGLLLFLALEKEFGIKFNINEMTDIDNIADIKKCIKNKGVML
jgi:acyl carrier protein